MKEIPFVELYKEMNHMQGIILKLEKRKNIIEWSKSDVRQVFKERYFGVLKNYYYGLSMLSYILYVDENPKNFPRNVRNHISYFGKLATTEEDFQSYFRQVQRILLIDSWSCFEDALTMIVRRTLTEDEFDMLRNRQVNDLLKILKNHALFENEVHRIKKTFRDKHIPITRKYEKLLNKYSTEENPRLLEFLRFYGAYRNTLHSNFIYNGQNFSFIKDGYKIEFKDGEPVYDGVPVKVYFDLAVDIWDCFFKIVDAVQFEGLIEDGYSNFSD